MKELISKFKEIYKQEPVLVCVPGSLNTDGDNSQFDNHQDLPVTYIQEMYFAIAPNGLHLCRVHAFNQKQSDAFFLMKRMSRSSRNWENAIKGVVAQYLKAGYDLRGFDLVFGSKEPIGTSISSITIERSFDYVLHHLSANYVEEFRLANATQKAEQVIA